MAIEHVNISDGERHEPKGISTAALGKVYQADGAASGAWVFPSGSVYSELYITGGSVAQTLSAASAFAKLNPTGMWTAGSNFGVTQIAADGTFTVLTAGQYKLNFWINFTTAAAASGSEYYFKYAVNGVVATRQVKTSKISNNADKLYTGAVGMAHLNVGDVVSIHVAGDTTTSGTAITATETGLTLMIMKAD
jgi:hypothetical protein